MSTTQRFLALACLTAAPLFVFAQANQQPQAAQAQPQPEKQNAAEEVDLRVPLQQLVLMDTEEACKAVPADAKGELVMDLKSEVFNKPEFRELVHSFMGRSVSTKLVNELALAVHEYIKKNDRLILHVNVPAQDASKGRLCLVVQVGRFQNIAIRGNRWFSREQLLYKLGVKPGDEVRPSLLEGGINSTNESPYRRVRVVVNDLRAGGKADLGVEVIEAAPYRFGVNYDNAGSEILGKNRFTASASYANLWGMDHQVSYQFTTSDKYETYQVHSVDYRAPLENHSSLQFNAAFAKVNASFENGVFNSKGTNYYGLGRYERSYQWRGFTLQATAGLDYKNMDNNLEFFSISARQTTVSVIQGTFGGSAMRRDKWGGTMVGFNLSMSPGGIGKMNDDQHFRAARALSDSTYVYGSLNVQRLVTLPWGFQTMSTGAFQTSSANLQSSEQMTIGGIGTVRGYGERIASGDTGFLINNELQGPTWSVWRPAFARKVPASTIRAITFIDYGHVWNKFEIASDPRSYAMLSSGLGLRWDFAQYGSVSLDYGWKLRPMTYSMDNEAGRFHMRASVSF